MSIVLRHHFSIGHLKAAAIFRDSANAQEQAGPASADDRSRHLASVTASIMCSTAFLEASLNEFLFETPKGWPGHTKEVTSLAAGVWSQLDKGKGLSALEKYDLALLMFGQAQFDKGAQPYQDAALAIRLRNMLVHPELEHEDASGRIESRYAAKFEPLRQGGSRPYFPDQLLSASCARWALLAHANVVLEFYRRTNVDYLSKHYVSILDGV